MILEMQMAARVEDENMLNRILKTGLIAGSVLSIEGCASLVQLPSQSTRENQSGFLATESESRPLVLNKDAETTKSRPIGGIGAPGPMIEDPQTRDFVRKTVQKLGSSVEVQLLGVELVSGFPDTRAFSLDSRALFVPRNSYLSLRYENEFVALLAWELARRGGGVYQVPFTALEREKTFVRDAVNLMYRSGFDPRGLVAFLERHQNEGLARRLGASEGVVETLVTEVRNELSALPPLINPITRSEEFNRLRQKWQSKEKAK